MGCLPIIISCEIMETTWILGGDQLDFWRISPKIYTGFLICPPSSGCRNLEASVALVTALGAGAFFISGGLLGTWVTQLPTVFRQTEICVC